MARSYSSKLIAFTIGVEPKWLDNLLSRHSLPGVSKARQGVERRISDQGLLASEICRILNLELGVSLEKSAAIARAAMESRSERGLTYATASGLALDFPLHDIERRLRERMVDAAESIARVPRGRPRRDHTPSESD